MAVETTTVQGKILTPSGDPVTDGTIVATLSEPGVTPDGAGSSDVGGSASGTIAADGTVTGLALVPNDAITPAGTFYLVRVTINAPYRSSWIEKWSVATAPDPVDVGAIVRL